MVRRTLTRGLVFLLLTPPLAALAKNPSDVPPAPKAPADKAMARDDASRSSALPKKVDGATTPHRPGRHAIASARGDEPMARGAGVHSFDQLHIVTPIDKLPPLASIRLHDRLYDRVRAKRKTIRILITTAPGRASVRWGGRPLGKTPVTVKAPEGSTPMDLVIRRAGFMTLRTRVQRRVSRKYFFKLHPAKFR